MYDEYKDILNRLITFPLRSQIKMNFDMKRKIFHLSLPIFSSRGDLPKCVEEYVVARKNHNFKPHSTSFKLDGRKVVLVQEIPFDWGFQPGFREHVNHFWNMGKRLNRMFAEMDLEEKYKNALYLDFDTNELN